MPQAMTILHVKAWRRLRIAYVHVGVIPKNRFLFFLGSHLAFAGTVGSCHSFVFLLFIWHLNSRAQRQSSHHHTAIFVITSVLTECLTFVFGFGSATGRQTLAWPSLSSLPSAKDPITANRPTDRHHTLLC